MVGDWKELALGDVIELKRGYDLPQQHRRKGPIPIVSSSGITDYHEESMAKGPGVVTGRYGTLGQVFYIAEDFWPLNTTLYVRDFKGNDPRFISYFLRSIDFLAFSDKAAVPGLNRNHLHMARILFPVDITEQRSIAQILGDLDDRILLNHKTSETLEAIAQAIFKAWFMDFEPVIAKVEGRWQRGQSLPGVSSELYDLFPDRLVNSELGALPEGWTIAKIGSLVDTISDTYPLSTVSEVVFLNTGDIKEGRFLHNTKSLVGSLPGQAKKSIKQNDILYSEIRPENKRFAYVHFDSSDHVVSTKLMVLRSCGSVDSLFTYFVLKQQDVIDFLQMMAESRSGTFPQITFDVLSQVETVLPSPTLLDWFTERILRPLFLRKLALDKEAQVLVSLRDTLLPKLISGELKVKDTERLLLGSVA